MITDVDSTNATTRPVVLLTDIRDGSDEAISVGETTLYYVPQGVAVTRTAAGWCDPHLVTITLNSHWLLKFLQWGIYSH